MTNLFQETLLQQRLRQEPVASDPLTGGFTGDILRGGVEASPILEQTVQEEPEFGKMEVLKAAFASENTIGSAIASLGAGNFGEDEEDPEFEIFSRIENTAYEPYLDSFTDVFSEKQFNRVSAKIDNERRNREITAGAGGFGVAAMIGAGIFDPVNLIPVGGSAYKAFKAGKVVRGIARGAQAGGLSTIASEAILQNSQETRTLEESAFNVAGATILGGMIGGTAAKLSGKQFKGLAKRVEDDIQRQESQINIDNDGNLSAAKTPRTTLDQETLAGGKITQAIIKSTKKLNPMLRVLEGASLEARRLIPKLVRTNMYFKKNADEIATDQSVEIAIKSYDKGLGFGTLANNKLAKQAVKRLRKEGVKMSKQDFNDQVSLAMIRGDVSEIPEVQAAAASWRREVFNPLKEQAIEQKLLSPDVDPKTAVSYMMRQYNVRKIFGQENEFKDIIRTGARERLLPQIRKDLKVDDMSPAQLKKFEIELKENEAKIFTLKGEDFSKSLDRQMELKIILRKEFEVDKYIDEIADSVFDNIRGIERKGVSMPYDMKVGVRGPAKERVLTFVTDEELRPFLETDINRLAQNYTRVMAADVELQRSFGDLNLEPQLAVISKEYTKLRKAAKTEKERVKLEKEESETREIINAFKDMIRGDYGRPNNPDAFWPRAARISRMVQYMSKLGGVAVSSIPDAGRHVMIHGFGRVFNKGIKGMITNTKGFKLSLEDARQAGQLMEAVTHQRAALMADVADPYASGTQFERTLTWMSNNFSKVSLLDYWNNYQKGFSSVLTQQRMIENIKNFDNLAPKESRYMAFLGIDGNNIRELKQQIKAHSFKEQDFDIADLKNWTDPEAARVYKNAMNTDVDRTIVTKGIGDIPLLMNTELGKTVGQFKSFAFAAHQQVLISGMQQGDMAAVSGIMTMISMGMMTYYLKTIGAGREVSDDPLVWIAEGYDRSGVNPVIMEINGLADGFGFGAGRLTSGQPLSRFASRNATGRLLGPSFGGVQDIFTVSRAISVGEFSDRDMRAVRKNIPGQNIFYLRTLIDEAEKALQK